MVADVLWTSCLSLRWFVGVCAPPSHCPIYNVAGKNTRVIRQHIGPIAPLRAATHLDLIIYRVLFTICLFDFFLPFEFPSCSFLRHVHSTQSCPYFSIFSIHTHTPRPISHPSAQNPQSFTDSGRKTNTPFLSANALPVILLLLFIVFIQAESRKRATVNFFFFFLFKPSTGRTHLNSLSALRHFAI